MCGTYFHDLSHSLVTPWIYSSERWKKFRRSLEILRLQLNKKVLGAISRIMRPKLKLLAVKFRRILEVFALPGLWRRFWAHIHDLYVQKWSCFLRSSNAFRKFSPYEVYNKSSVRIITILASTNEAVCREVQADFRSFLHAGFTKKLWRIFSIFASKNEAVCREVQTDFGSVLRARFIKKFMAHYLEFLHPKMKLFAVEFRRILEVFALWGLWRKFLAYDHDFCVQKRSCWQWSWDAFWKFFACKFWRKSSWRIITTFASKNEAVCCLSSDAFWKFSLCEVYKEIFGRIVTIFASKNEAVDNEDETHFGSSLPANFEEKVHGALSRLLRPKMKRFAV